MIKNFCSTLEKCNLVWIRNLIGAYIIVTIIFLVSKSGFFSSQSLYVGPFTVFSFTFVLGYLALRQQSVQGIYDNSIAANKYHKSGLSEKMAEHHLVKLNEYMKKNKPFLDCNLTLPKLAQSLMIAPNHLSQILNERLSLNFFDFINRHRVEEVKKLLNDPANGHLNILSIAYESGFSSKSSFNSIFKRHTNLTPFAV